MKTSFLFAMPSLLSGMARLLDPGGTYNQYNSSPNASEADAMAIYSDFRMIGQDLHRAMMVVYVDNHDPPCQQTLDLAFHQESAAVRHGEKNVIRTAHDLRTFLKHQPRLLITLSLPLSQRYLQHSVVRSLTRKQSNIMKEYDKGQLMMSFTMA